ncbi:MAG: sensor histidine kinase [Fimbriimonas sp.]
MRFGSLRFKLIAWNLAVLAIAIVVFTGAQSYGMVSRLESDIDSGLQQMGMQAARLGPPGPEGHGGPGAMGGPIGQGGGMGQGGPGPPAGMHQPDGPPPGQFQGGMGIGPPPPERMSDVRRPRFFDRDRKGIGQSRNLDPIDPAALNQALQGWSGFTTVDRIRVFTVPWGDGEGAVQVAHELRDVDLLRSGQAHSLLLLLPAALLLAGVGAFFLAERALRPIGAITRTAKAIGASDLSQRLDVGGDDEFAELASTFNGMIARLEGSFAEIKKAYAELEEAYTRQRQFTADASHELRTPLTRLKLATSSALSGSSEQDYRKALEVADKAGVVMARLIDQLLMLARADAGSLTLPSSTVDLRLVASDAISSYPSDRKIEVCFADDPVEVLGDAELLQRVVTNLIENGLRHSEGTLLVAVNPQGDQAILEVKDFGEGIPAEHLPHLFERFYRVDAARSRSEGGTGLGLAICKSIVEAHHGRIEVKSDIGVGTIFTVFLPILKKANTQTISS